MIRDVLDEMNAIWRSMNPPWRTQFRPPADPAAIDQAEEAIGLPFPRDLREVLLWANGQDDSFLEVYAEPIFPSLCVNTHYARSDSYWLSGCTGVVSHYAVFLKSIPHYETYNFEVCGPATVHKSMIPFTFSDGSSGLVLDLSPLKGGCYGQVVYFSELPYEIAVLAPDLNTFLSDMLQGFRTDRFAVKDEGPHRRFWEP